MSASKQLLKDRSHDSSAVQLEHMKKIMEIRQKEKANKDGLDPDTIKCKVTTRAAKVNLIVAAVEGEVAFSKKTLLIKTEARFRAEHSVMSGFSYATTCLMTHYIEGRKPSWMRNIDMTSLPFSVKKTLDMVKGVFGTDEFCPVNPSLVLSTDDSSLFVFEGTSRDVSGEEKWEWKLIDVSNNNASVRSDFEVGDDSENSGGLRVRLTFTFTASGFLLHCTFL